MILILVAFGFTHTRIFQEVFLFRQPFDPAGLSFIHLRDGVSMSSREITQHMYAYLMQINPSHTLQRTAPVDRVSYWSALEFCNRLSSHLGRERVYQVHGNHIQADFSKNGFRLPTEAEFVLAYRGDSKTHFWWGNTPLNSFWRTDVDLATSVFCSQEDIPAANLSAHPWAWFAHNSEGQLHPVGLKAPNPLGFYDLAGNVWEMCEPENWSPGFHVPIRGGSVRDGPRDLRWAARRLTGAGFGGEAIGFRVCSGPPIREITAGECEISLTRLTNGSLIGTCEVTQKQFETLMGWNNSQGSGDHKPVENVSPREALEFCNRLSRITGRQSAYQLPLQGDPFLEKGANGFRLPTSREWIDAALAGEGDPVFQWPFWDELRRKKNYQEMPGSLTRFAWIHSNSQWMTHTVGQRQPNPRGIHDLLGNVGEWAIEDQVRPFGRAVSLGGSYQDQSPSNFLPISSSYPLDYTTVSVGFRVFCPGTGPLPMASETVRTVFSQGQTVVTLIETPAASAVISLPRRPVVLDEPGYHAAYSTRLLELPNDLKIGQAEVTQALFQECFKYNPAMHRHPELPVHGVALREAAEFCNWMSRREGLKLVYEIRENSVRRLRDADGYRLPTTREWAYAFAGGTWDGFFGTFAGKKWYRPVPISSRELALTQAWFAENSEGTPHLPGQCGENPWGLADMAGNVAEWCLDETDVWVTSGALVGGSWNSPLEDLGVKSFRRVAAVPDEAGFRLCRGAAVFEKEEKAWTDYRLRAWAGDGEAWLWLAERSVEGMIIPFSLGRACLEMRIASQLGFQKARSRLQDLTQQTSVLEKTEVQEWLNRNFREQKSLCEVGVPQRQFWLGFVEYHGIGQPVRRQAGLETMKKALSRFSVAPAGLRHLVTEREQKKGR